MKILSKAMDKQIDRVMNDLRGQREHFHRKGGRPITVAIVGVNSADYTIGYEKDREYRTDGRENPHPSQEEAQAIRDLKEEIGPKFDELIILRYNATNDPPYPFEWTSYSETFGDYSASITRISREYDIRFGD